MSDFGLVPNNSSNSSPGIVSSPSTMSVPCKRSYDDATQLPRADWGKPSREGRGGEGTAESTHSPIGFSSLMRQTGFAGTGGLGICDPLLAVVIDVVD